MNPIRCVRMAEPLAKPRYVTDLGVSNGTANRLYVAGMYKVADLMALSEAELAKLKGMGTLALKEIRRGLASLGLSLRRD